MKKVGVLVFPGSNCDYDAYYAVKKVLKQEAEFIWHKDTKLRYYDAIVIPGGFSYGDYLRAGAIAQFSPIMERVIEFAENGKPVIGICNGFQILLEMDLLPGALITNDHLKFRCDDVYLKVTNNATSFTSEFNKEQIIKLPIAHQSGNYYAGDKVIQKLEDENRIVFKYCDADGQITEEANPNGSLRNIAGIINEEGNVLGMMPHPERAMEPILESTDGVAIFESLLEI
ncbi:MAG: phosphoribosylformylglycinamidine synthase subunit PurQ [Candidatus Marinimicrobia bacterium]|nr:phosphoribosylformylglycinamidine synthase subunit PurQ [Candidatus Neomarinimicrobiota bacterium]